MKPLHYKAFISYSHQDEAWARWLQKSLENYRVPRRLAGSRGSFGEIPRRLTPIFRDREDLSSAADLSSKIKAELQASETLVVICSPTAAKSQWVNEEIRHFRQLGREERILALIVDGDPQAADPAQQCFPPALVRRLDGQPYEPLAADARKYADGKPLSRLKLVAGMLGVRLDELRRREAQRQRRNWLALTAAVALILAVTASLAITAISARKAVLQQRSNSEELLNYMLGNLKSLDPIVGLEVVDRNDEQVMNYLDNLGFQQMDNEQLVEMALALRTEGESLHGRRELDAALEPLQKSRAAFIELHQREGGSKRALFELGQAEFYVGYVYMDKGELDAAQASFTRYGAITRRLVNADPNNAVNVMELAYTLVNLSALERARQNPDMEEALQLIQSALQYNQMALVLDPDNDEYRQELSKTMAFLADAWLDICDLGKAWELKRQTVGLSRQLAQAEPQNESRQLELAYRLSGMATVQKQMSLTEQALEGLRESASVLEQQLERDAENLALRWEILLRRQRINWILANSGDSGKAWEESRALAADFETAFTSGMQADYQAAVELAEFNINQSILAHRMGDADAAQAELQRALDSLTSLVREKPENRSSRYQLARALFEKWAQAEQSPTSQEIALLDGYLAEPGSVKSCTDTSLAARLAMMRGDKDRARDYTSYLLNRGFFDPEFIVFCRDYGICE